MKPYPVDWEPIYIETEQTNEAVKRGYAQKFSLYGLTQEEFLELAEMWWWESNRLIPINVFLKAEWVPFRTVVKTMNSKDVEIKFGPQVSLKEIAAKRSKRRSITLVRKLG